MFSYLQGIRPGAGRRHATSHASNPNRPEDTRFIHTRPAYTEDLLDNYNPQPRIDTDRFRTTPVSSSPPVLPPIPRVASKHDPQEPKAEKCMHDVVQMQATIDYEDTKFSSSNEGSFHFRPGKVRGLAKEQSYRFVKEEYMEKSLPQQPIYGVPTPQTTEARGIRRPPMRSNTEPTITPPVQTDNSLCLPYQSSQNTSQPMLYLTPQTSNTEVGQIRHSRPMLNRLNPMSLLARRRSAQAAAQANDELLQQGRNTSISGVSLPADYDPRIRGKVVHDFSAPRPRRNVNAQFNAASAQLDSPTQHSSEWSKHKPHEKSISSNIAALEGTQDVTPISERQRTPVFSENFGKEMESWQFDVEDRKNQLNHSFMDQIAPQDLEQKPLALPPFARNLPSALIQAPQTHDALPKPNKPPTTFSERAPTTPPRPRLSIASSHSASPSVVRSRATSITDDTSYQSAGLPKHLKSTASRFSFDLAGVGSAAQEKLLEERHRQKNTKKVRDSTMPDPSLTAASEADVDENEDFQYDDLDDDGVYEEKIPGVNADAEEDEVAFLNGVHGSQNTIPHNSSSLLNRVKVSSLVPSSLNPAHNLLGSSYKDNSFQCQQSKTTSLSSKATHPINPADGILGVTERDICMNQRQSNQIQHMVNELMTREPHKPSYDDDLYFDDGMIDDFDSGNATMFDESVFDDETSRVYGLPLRDLEPLPPVIESTTAETSPQSTRPTSLESGAITGSVKQVGLNMKHLSLAHLKEEVPTQRKSFPGGDEKSKSNFDQSAGLTHDNLVAYHNALAFATNRAAFDGIFNRSLSIDHGEVNETDGWRKGRVSFGENNIEHAENSSNLNQFQEDGATFDFDDGLDDDAIIAAANAEALENDDEGFYGQEFGFFAHADGSDGAQYVNGGFFGSVGAGGVKRSHSGHANFQEPSLTPITERSEFSQRNSMISLAMHNGLPSSLQNPGLAQLADSLQYEDDNMSLSALMKLRRGAWGGSNSSLHSSLGSLKNGSPLTTLPPLTPGGTSTLNSSFDSSDRLGSSHSLASTSGFSTAAEEDQSTGSPTLTLQTQGLTMTAPSMQLDKSSGPDSSPKRRNAIKAPVKTPVHSRNNSGTESISYVKEIDEGGTGRWMVEKRRMVDGGQLELLGRQIVEGGRI